MKERPILFSSPMVRAILEGRKTQTRRVIKSPYLSSQYPSMQITPDGNEFLIERWPRAEREMNNFGRCDRILCPHGTVGDGLWVRETFALCGIPIVRYYATDDVSDLRKKRPAIHMPRSFSRINLEITNVRVERVQSISEEDAVAEGVEAREDLNRWKAYHLLGSFTYLCKSAKDSYRSLWDTINGKTANDWNSNPWVWVITFRRL